MSSQSSSPWLRRRLPLFAVVACAATVLAAPAPAEARTLAHLSESGLHAAAQFSGQTGCVYTSAMIDANNGQVTDKVSHATFAGTTARFDIQSYDACNDYTPLHNGFAYDVLLPTGSFVIDSRLNSATLDASVSLYDYVTQGELNLAV